MFNLGQFVFDGAILSPAIFRRSEEPALSDPEQSEGEPKGSRTSCISGTREIPRPAAESAGRRDDASREGGI
jgi:hypothetical protein